MGVIEVNSPAFPGTTTKSLFCRVHAALASRLSMSLIIATSMSVSLVCTFRS
jgi:hypothetical protein